jgi:dolichyl-diphosphooligosaccharide--protein glycosyltransferase
MARRAEASRSSLLRALALPTGLFALALLARLLSWHSVFRPDGIYFFDNDSYYHLRRIQYSVAHFPAVLRFDPFIAHPHGGQPIWPPTLDWLVALLLRPIAGPARPELVERIAVFLPPVVGAATVVALVLVARRFFSTALAALAGAILAVLPAHCYYSQLGFVDHHVAVGLLSLLLLASAMSLLHQGDPARGALRPSALAGAAMAGCLLLWPGSLIHVALVQAGMLARLLATPGLPESIARARGFALANAVACACVAPLSAGNEWMRWGSFSAVVLSNFQPVYLGTAALCFAVPAELWRRGRLCADRRTRAVAALGLGAALLALLLLVAPGLRGAAADAWAWLARREEFQAVVNESTPLFGDFGSDYRSRAVVMLTAFVYAVPIAIAALGWQERRRPDRLFFAGFSLALFLATLAQWRFVDSYSVAHALLLAWALCALWRGLASRLASRPAIRRALAPAAAAAVALLFWPMAGAQRAHLSDVWRGVSGREPGLSPLARQRGSLVATARWLRENSAWHEDESWAVLGPWGDGHILKYVAERPVVQDNFGDDVGEEGFALAEDYFAARSEEEALRVIARTGTRYVLVRSTGSGHARGPYARDSLFARLFDWNGSSTRVAAAAGEADLEVPALERHRIVYESSLVLGRGPGARAYARLFEVVEGARLLGEADPGAPVEARLALDGVHGRFDFVARSRADASGRYALRLPYPNDRFSPAVRAARHYRVTSGAASGRAEIPEAAVRSGAEVPGPSLRGAAGPPA